MPIDYSAWSNSAWNLANANAGAVAQVGAKIEGMIEQRKKNKDTVKVSADKIDAAIRLFGDQGGYLTGIRESLKDEDTPLSQRAALGGQIDEMLNLGIDKMRNDAIMGLQREQLGLEGRRVDLAERAFQTQETQQIAALEGDEQMAMSDAITRMTALREAELSAGDRIPQMKASNDLIDSLIAQGRGKEALKAVENYAKVREPQLEQFMKPQTVKPLKIGGTGAAGEPVEIDAFVTPTGQLFDVQGQPLNAPQGPAAQGGLPATPDAATDALLPPREDIPGARIPATPRIGVRPTTTPQTPEQKKKAELELAAMESEVKAKETTKAAAIDSAQSAIKLLEDLPKHPGFEAAVGSGFAKTLLRQDEAVRGTDRAGAEAIINQLKGGAFLNAIQQMKGMGALSNAEGEKVAQAAARLDANQSEKDFKAALAEYKDIMQRGVDRLKGMTETSVAPPADNAARLRALRGQ